MADGYTPPPREFRPFLRRLVDFCCDRHGCGHHIDGHGRGEDCYVPGCPCTGWRDHVGCDHRNDGAEDAERAATRALEAAWPRPFGEDPVHAGQVSAVAVRAAVAALAGAGRLLPEDTRTEAQTRADERRQIAEALRKRAEAFDSYDARDALREFAEDIHDRRVGSWVPVPTPPGDTRMCGAFQPAAPPLKPFRCTEPAGHDGGHRAIVDGETVGEWLSEEKP